MVPLDLDRPYWVDDPDLDLDFHIRALALPAAGQRRAARRAGGPHHRPAARPLPTAVGVVRHHRPRGRRVRRAHEAPPRHHRRRLRRRAHPAAARLRPRRGDAASPATERWEPERDRRATSPPGRTALGYATRPAEDGRAAGAAARGPRPGSPATRSSARWRSRPCPALRALRRRCRRAPRGDRAAHADRALGAPRRRGTGRHRPPPLRLPHAAPRRRQGGEAARSASPSTTSSWRCAPRAAALPRRPRRAPGRAARGDGADLGAHAATRPASSRTGSPGPRPAPHRPRRPGRAPAGRSTTRWRRPRRFTRRSPPRSSPT